MGYRASASKGAKPSGQSAAAKHAYHLRADGYAVGRDGPREDLAASGHGNLPEFAADDPAAFWLASDSFERANGTLYRELQVNLPHELGLTQQQQVLQKFCARMFDRERLPHSWAIHNHADGGDHVPDDNGHGHIMVSETMTDDFPRPAEQHFKRHNSAKPEAGGAKKTRSLKPKSWLMEARAAWAEEVNRGLVAAGHKPRFDHRSKKVQRDEALRLGDLRQAARLDTPTQAHEGPRIAGMRRRVEAGKVALEDLPSYAQEVIKDNDRVRQYASEWLAQVEQMTDGELAEHFADELNHGAHVEAWLLHEHAQALEEDRARSVAIAQQAGELELLTAAQIEAAELEQAHVAALAEDKQRQQLHDEIRQQMRRGLADGTLTRATCESLLGDLLGADVSGLQRAVERLQSIEVVEQAHAAALAEDVERSVLHDRLRHQLRHALAEGALDRAGGQAVLDRLVGADAAGIRSAVVDVAELRAELAELVASEAHQQTVELGQLAAVQAVQADDLVDQYNQRLARLGLHQLPDLDLGDPAPLIHHDDEPQWLVVENGDGEVIGHWSDDPDAQWRYDHDADDWVEHDPDHRPSSGPRMG